MTDTPFKTPLPMRTPHRTDAEEYFTPTAKMTSDSEESTTSETAETASAHSGHSGSSGDITFVAEFDDMMRLVRQLRADKAHTTRAFLDFAEQTKALFGEWSLMVAECQRLQTALDDKTHECTDLEHKLMKARTWLDQEKAKTRLERNEKLRLLSQIHLVQETLKDRNCNDITEGTRRKFSFLTDNCMEDYNNVPQLSTIKEVNSTGSMLSDFSYSRSEEELDNDNSHAQNGKSWRKHRPSSGGVAGEPAVKKRKSSSNKAVEIAPTDTVRATTTLTLSKGGPITATSVIEAVPKTPSPEPNGTNTDPAPSAPPASLVFDSWARESPRKPERHINHRRHIFQDKIIVMPLNCVACESRIRFGKTALKCRECKATCHMECKESLPLPCVPMMNTPTQRQNLLVIQEWVPTTPPMVPGLLIHCINEIELRGLDEIGIYRVSAAERDVKTLKEKFLRGKGTPCLRQVDVHVLCGTVKDFLRSLNEPLVTYKQREIFAQAINLAEEQDIPPIFYQAVSEMPQPNRDTLAYMILHLQKVASCPTNKMTTQNLAKVFGPTIVGYSSSDPHPDVLLNEMVIHNKVMEYLLNIPSDYWSTFVDIDTTLVQQKTPSLQQTPSTDSLLRQSAARSFFTPNRSLLVSRKQKYFASPR